MMEKKLKYGLILQWLSNFHNVMKISCTKYELLCMRFVIPSVFENKTTTLKDIWYFNYVEATLQ